MNDTHTDYIVSAGWPMLLGAGTGLLLIAAIVIVLVRARR